MHNSIFAVFRWLAVLIALTNITATSSMSQESGEQESDPSGAIICSWGPSGDILVLLGFEHIRYEIEVNQWFNFVGSTKGDEEGLLQNEIAIREVDAETGGAFSREVVEKAINNPLGVFDDAGQFPLYVIQLPYRERFSTNNEKKKFRWIELATLKCLVEKHKPADGPLLLPDFGEFRQLSSYALNDFQRDGIWAAAKKAANPEPVNPEPVNPEPVNPEPVNPEPVNPEPVNPEPVNPEPVNEGTDSLNSDAGSNSVDEVADSLISIAENVDENKDVRIQSMNALTQLKLGSSKWASVALSFCQIASNAGDLDVDVKTHAIQSISTLLKHRHNNDTILTAVVNSLKMIAQDISADSTMRQATMQVLTQLELDDVNRGVVAKALAAVATNPDETNIDIRLLAIELLVPLLNQGSVTAEGPVNVDEVIRAKTIATLGDVLGNVLELEGTRIEAANKLISLRPYSREQKMVMLQRFQCILRSTQETDAFKIRAIQWLNQLNGSTN